MYDCSFVQSQSANAKYLCTMQILDGKLTAQHIKDELKKEVNEIIANGNRSPHLAAILVGNNGASETYVASKIKSCAEIGFQSSLLRFNADVSEAELLACIQKINEDNETDGILVQLPLPKHIDEQK